MRSANIVFIAILCCLYGSMAVAQPDTLWTKTYGAESPETIYSIQQLPDGGYMLGGITFSIGAGDADIWLIRTDANGDSLWSRTYGGADFDDCAECLYLGESGFILCGSTRSFGAGGYDFSLLRLDINGDSLWSKTYGGRRNDACLDITVTADGGYMLGGYTDSFGSGSKDFWLVRTDENGDSLWSRTFGGRYDDFCLSMERTEEGNVYLAGATYSFGLDGTSDMWLVVANEDGDSLWSQGYGSRHYNERANSLVVTPEGHIALAGYVVNNGNFDCQVVFTDIEQGTSWTRTYPGRSCGYYHSIINDIEGGFVLCGWVGFPADVWLSRIDANGDIVWDYSCGGDGEDAAMTVIQTEDRGYAVVGQTESLNEGDCDVWLIKVGAYSSVTNNRHPIIPTACILSSPYPNPFNSTTTIGYSLPAVGNVSVAVFDLSGREVARLADGVKVAGNHEVVWAADGVVSGVYMVKLDAGGVVAREKVVLVK